MSAAGSTRSRIRAVASTVGLAALTLLLTAARSRVSGQDVVRAAEAPVPRISREALARALARIPAGKKKDRILPPAPEVPVHAAHVARDGPSLNLKSTLLARKLAGVGARVEAQTSRPGIPATPSEAAALWRQTVDKRDKRGGAAGLSDPCAECRVGDIACGEMVDGSLDVEDCEFGDGARFDVWAFDLADPRLVTFTMTSSEIDTYVMLINGACEFIADNDDCTLGELTRSCLTAQLPPGSYFVVATSFGGGELGGYALGIECIDFDPCGDCVVGAAVCGEQEGSLSKDDCALPGDGSLLDAWSFEVTESQLVTINLTSLQFDPVLFLANSSCEIIASNDDCTGQGLNSCLTLPLQPGTYFLIANAFDSGESGFYRLLIDCRGLGVCSDCVVGSVECGGRAGGVLSGDSCDADGGGVIDLWRLDIAADFVQQVDVSLDAPGGQTLRVFDAFCQPVGVGEACASGSPCFSGALEPGAYFVGVEQPASAPQAEYVIDVACRDFDPFVDCFAGALACNATANGELTATDCVFEDSPFVDIWTLTVDEPTQVDIEMRSSAIDTTLLLFAIDSDLFFVNDDCVQGGATDSCISAQLPPGEYALLATSFAVGETGPYSLQMGCGEITLCRDCELGTVECGDVKTGTLVPAKCRDGSGAALDLWRFENPTAGRISVALASQEFDTFVWLYGAGCVPVASNDDCGDTLNSCLDFFAEPGEYWVAVSSFAPGDSGSYTLSVDCPDFRVCASCPSAPVECGQRVEGVLSDDSCSVGGGAPGELWSFELVVPLEVSIELASAAFDPELVLLNEDCDEVASNDDCSATSLDSCLTLRLDAGRYTIAASSIFTDASGAYTLQLDCAGVNGGQLPGDSNQDGHVNIADSICLLHCVFLGDPPRLPCGDGLPSHEANMALLDSDGDTKVGLGDAVYLVSYLFRGTAPPVQGTRCIGIPGCGVVCRR